MGVLASIRGALAAPRPDVGPAPVRIAGRGGDDAVGGGSAYAYAPPQFHWGPSGWKGLQGTPPPWEQNGVYRDVMLSQYPARVEGAQRRCVVGELYPGWVVPYRSLVPLAQTVQSGGAAKSAGAQRAGGKPSSPAGSGPLAARAMRQAVLNAQIKQSGLQAMSWAQQINQWGSP